MKQKWKNKTDEVLKKKQENEKKPEKRILKSKKQIKDLESVREEG